MLQVVFAIIGAFTSIPIAFTAHVGGFVGGFLLTKVLVNIERKKGHSTGNTLKKMVDLGEYGEQ
jgi:membrane associated rhomboid family serine protease